VSISKIAVCRCAVQTCPSKQRASPRTWPYYFVAGHIAPIPCYQSGASPHLQHMGLPCVGSLGWHGCHYMQRVRKNAVKFVPHTHTSFEDQVDLVTRLCAWPLDTLQTTAHRRTHVARAGDSGT
jgi:hypothetical protein